MFKPQNKELAINDLCPKTLYDMCRKLNIKSAIVNNFKNMAAEIGGLSFDQITLISQTTDPTEALFRWWGTRKDGTVSNLQRILQAIGRKDVLEILNNDPKVKACSK